MVPFSAREVFTIIQNENELAVKQAIPERIRKADDEDYQIDVKALIIRCFENIHWIFLMGFLGASIAGLIVYFLLTPIYEATAKIYIVGSDTKISLSDLQIGTSLAADYQEVFKNWHVHELVDQKLDKDYSYAKLSDMVTVTNPANTHILYVTVRSTDPEEAKLLADTYANVSREFIAAKMDMREPNIFEEAKLPGKPVFPQKIKSIALGFGIGILIMVLIISIRFLNDDRIMSSDDIAKVGDLPTLGMIPLQEESQRTKQVASNHRTKTKKG